MAIWRKALFPFQILFAGVVLLRKKLYAEGVISRYVAPIPTIVVGNLATGGTGKTPIIDFLLRHFSQKKELGVLSRGYGRKSKGFLTVHSNAPLSQVGDEPLMLAQKHPAVFMAVCANRPKGIVQMLQQNPGLEAIFLDDALQHLALQPHFKIVLTTFQKPWFDDALLPVGNLREPSCAARDADIVVVTKCPKTIDAESSAAFSVQLGLLPHQALFFTTLAYETHVRGSSILPLKEFVKTPFVLITGIANPKTLVDFLKGQGADFTHLSYPDHHNFSKKEIASLKAMQQPILTTEKDAVRLANSALKEYHTIGVGVSFLDNEQAFIDLVQSAIDN
ncbi:MAG: tetraacyldisaccharide 4'-kinase [Flavobacteriaceae bacterium]|nr:tetraacyldisaccharide 4'-kinase [Flavobacteriaceae bacterium]